MCKCRFLLMAVLLLFGSQVVSSEDFVIIYPVLHPFFSATSKGARDEADKYTGLNIRITAPVNQSADDQEQLLESFIKDGVDAVAIGPADESLKRIIDEVVRAGIPVICIDTDAPDSERATYIGTDNYAAGFQMGRLVSEFLNGDGRVLISVSNLSTRNMKRRVSGFRDAIATDSGISIVAVEEGMADSELIFVNIETHINSEDFNAIVTMDAESGPMVVRMWKAWGLDYPVFCFDDRDLVLEGLRDGIVEAAVIQNQYEWGREAVSAMRILTRGGTVPAFIDTGHRVITRDNLDSLNP